MLRYEWIFSYFLHSWSCQRRSFSLWSEIHVTQPSNNLSSLTSGGIPIWARARTRSRWNPHTQPSCCGLSTTPWHNSVEPSAPTQTSTDGGMEATLTLAVKWGEFSLMTQTSDGIKRASVIFWSNLKTFLIIMMLVLGRVPSSYVFGASGIFLLGRGTVMSRCHEIWDVFVTCLPLSLTMFMIIIVHFV